MIHVLLFLQKHDEAYSVIKTLAWSDRGGQRVEHRVRVLVRDLNFLNVVEVGRIVKEDLSGADERLQR